jgi:hypothetical protein
LPVIFHQDQDQQLAVLSAAEARRLLGGIGTQRLWQLVSAGRVRRINTPAGWLYDATSVEAERQRRIAEALRLITRLEQAAESCP